MRADPYTYQRPVEVKSTFCSTPKKREQQDQSLSVGKGLRRNLHIIIVRLLTRRTLAF